jgi:hypothetical protein
MRVPSPGLSVEPRGETSLPGSRDATAGKAPNNALYRWWDWSFGTNFGNLKVIIQGVTNLIPPPHGCSAVQCRRAGQGPAAEGYGVILANPQGRKAWLALQPSGRQGSAGRRLRMHKLANHEGFTWDCQICDKQFHKEIP